MNLYDNIDEAKLDLQIAPLIDVVFLLLIYFMVTAALIKKEGDISFILPASVSASEAVTVPVEVVIQIDDDGTVELEGMRFSPSDEMLSDLVTQVKGLKQIAESQQSPFFVNILPHRNALHQRIIDVMDACAAADVSSLTFSRSM